LELREDRDILDFIQEHSLTKKPLSVDFMVIKKRTEAVIHNEIGRIFKTHNLFEYKSPNHGINIDSYYKSISYACLYKALGDTVDEIPAEEITISIVQEQYPVELIKKLKSTGSVIEEKFPGIYYISGNTLFPTQLIVTRRLNKKEHSSLRVLSARVEREDIQNFMTYLEQLTEQGDKENMDAVLQVSMAANTSAYDEIRKESRHMCEAFRELFKEEIDKEVEAGERRGRLEGERAGRLAGEREGRLAGEREGRLAGEREGRLAGERAGRREGEREGRLATLIGLAKDNLITISEAAKRAEMPEALFIERMTNFGK
jgi:hypothetical protein